MAQEQALTIEHLNSICHQYAPQNDVDRMNATNVYDARVALHQIVYQLQLARNIVVFLLALISLSSLSITKIVLYALFHDQCPLNQNVPVYLLATGVTVLFIIVLTLVLVIFFVYMQHDRISIAYLANLVTDHQCTES